jgi:hypothetical protein
MWLITELSLAKSDVGSTYAESNLPTPCYFQDSAGLNIGYTLSDSWNEIFGANSEPRPELVLQNVSKYFKSVW